eukprot:12422243-Karenia_brevis.AAC.1
MSSTLESVIQSVTVGSGQGLPHSGSVANSAFLMQNELSGARLGSKRKQAELGILCYLRYVDNLFFVLQDESRADPLLRYLENALSEDYSGKLEECSSDGCQFLDFQLYKSSAYDVESNAVALLNKPYMKNVGPILAQDSAHPAAVHLMWPV